MTIKNKEKTVISTKTDNAEKEVSFSPNKLKAKDKVLKTRRSFSLPKNHNYDDLFSD